MAIDPVAERLAEITWQVGPSEVLEACRLAGVTLTVDGERLAYRCPKGALTAELLAAIKENKAALMRLVGATPCPGCGAAGPSPPACPRCGAVTNHPLSLDHDTAPPWWCSACLQAQVVRARRGRPPSTSSTSSTTANRREGGVYPGP